MPSTSKFLLRKRGTGPQAEGENQDSDEVYSFQALASTRPGPIRSASGFCRSVGPREARNQDFPAHLRQVTLVAGRCLRLGLLPRGSKVNSHFLHLIKTVNRKHGFILGRDSYLLQCLIFSRMAVQFVVCCLHSSK